MSVDGLRSFDRSRPLETYTTFSMGSSLTAVRQGAMMPSTDILPCDGGLLSFFEPLLRCNPIWGTNYLELAYVRYFYSRGRCGSDTGRTLNPAAKSELRASGDTLLGRLRPHDALLTSAVITCSFV